MYNLAFNDFERRSIAVQPPTLVQMLSRLIAIPSMSSVDPRFDCGNRAVVECLANWFSDLGFQAELMPLRHHPDKLNLIARSGPGEGGLVLSGHADTVPYDEGAWSTDPFTLTERDGRLYGLGAADMKNFFPLILAAVGTMDLRALTRPLVILATADEESSMAGIRALAAAGERLGRYALIGEPTALKPVYMHKGVTLESIRLRGRSGHASNPRLGNNAIDGMHRVLGALMEWRGELQAAYADHDFEVPGPTLNLGNIHGGDSPNRICAECEIQIDIRTLPGMPFDSVHQALVERVERAVAGSGLFFEVRPLVAGIDALKTDRDSAIVQSLERLTGLSAGTVSFATEGPFLNALGIETAICGPGDIAQAHQPDEYVDGARLLPMQSIIKALITEYCLGG